MEKMYFLLCLLFILISCSESDIIDSNSIPEVNSSDIIDLQDAVNNSYEIFDNIKLDLTSFFPDYLETRSTSQSIDKAKTQVEVLKRDYKFIDSIGVDNNYTLSSQSIPVYIIKYKTELNEPAGSIIYVGDKRYTSNVFAYNPKESINIFQNPDSAFWLDRLDNFIHTMRDQPVEEVIRTKMSFRGRFHDIRWHQGSPFTRFTPFIQPNVRGVAGCVPIAVGQIMTFYQWPRKGMYWRQNDNKTWSVQNTVYNNWSQYPNKSVDEYSESVKNEAAHLLAEIGYRVVARYKENGETEASDNGAVYAFAQMGYKKPLIHRFKASNALSEFAAGRAIYLAARYSSTSQGHAYMSTNAIYHIGLDNVWYMHVNLGWGGSEDNFVRIDAFENSTYINSYVPTYNCMYIHGIEPDYSHEGGNFLPWNP